MKTKSIFIIIILLVPTVSASIGNGQGMAYGVAVRGDEGILILVEVTISRGDGSVTIDADFKYDELVALSTTIALYRAAIDAGLNPYSLNYTVRMRTNSSIGLVSGPSLALAVYAAAAASMGSTPQPSKTVYTGTVMIDGIVGVVGKVREKMNASWRAGVEKLVIPEGQASIYRVIEENLLVGVTLIEVERLEVEPLPPPPQGLELVTVASTRHIVERTQVESTAHAGTYPPESVVIVVVEEATSMAREALRLAKDSRLPPRILEDVRDNAFTALEIVNKSMCLEDLAEAYGKASYSYYLALSYNDPEGAYDRLRKSIDDLLHAARSLEPTSVDAIGAYMLGLSRYGQVVAASSVEDALVALRAFQAGLIGLEGYSKSLARAAYSAGYYVVIAAIAAASATHGNVDLEDIRRLVDLAGLVCEYVKLYSEHTGVASYMVPMSCSHWAGARMALEDGDWPLAAFHAVEAIALASAYHGAAPGLPDIVGLRINASLESLQATPSWAWIGGHWYVKEQLNSLGSRGMLDDLYTLGRLHAITILAAISGPPTNASTGHGQNDDIPEQPSHEMDKNIKSLLTVPIILVASYIALARRPRRDECPEHKCSRLV